MSYFFGSISAIIIILISYIGISSGMNFGNQTGRSEGNPFPASKNNKRRLNHKASHSQKHLNILNNHLPPLSQEISAYRPSEPNFDNDHEPSILHGIPVHSPEYHSLRAKHEPNPDYPILTGHPILPSISQPSDPNSHFNHLNTKPNESAAYEAYLTNQEHLRQSTDSPTPRTFSEELNSYDLHETLFGSGAPQSKNRN